MATRKTPAKSNTSKDDLLHYYREMLLIRRFEEKAGQLYGMGLIGGFCHLYIGQEAVVVGLEAAAPLARLHAARAEGVGQSGWIVIELDLRLDCGQGLQLLLRTLPCLGHESTQVREFIPATARE